jgi:hypothetical protein
MYKKTWKVLVAFMLVITMCVGLSSATIDGKITSVQIEPERLVVGQPISHTIVVENTGTERFSQYDPYIWVWQTSGGWVRGTKEHIGCLDVGDTKTILCDREVNSPGEIIYKYELEWTRHDPTSGAFIENVLLDTVVEERRCFSAEEVTPVAEVTPTEVATLAATGSISVSSTPSGACIYLDGVYQGVTGSAWFWIYDVSAGYHTIYLEKSGYEDYTETVYISTGDTASVSAYLTATPTPTTIVTSTPVPTGGIRVWSSPSGARIYLDGVYQGATGSAWFRIYDVSTGYHTIRLEKSRYEDYTETIYISAGDTAAVSAYLTATPTTGSISVSSAPSGADIYLDGAYKGTTPATIPDVPTGSHALKLEKYGYAEWLTSVHVTSGVTESITTHLTATDVSPPAIRIDKPATIDQNNNGLLEEGEKVTITYGANDPGGVASIRIMLDGTTLESQNRAGTYTVTTSPLSVGTHTIRVEATDSKSNSGFEELLLTVERTGPSVYFGTTRTTIKKGEDAIFTLSAVNPIGNPPITVQLILKPPSGVSVTSSSFAKAGSGIYTCTQVIESGDNVRSIEVRLTGNQIGTHEIASEVYYQFTGSPKSPTRYETLTLIVEQDALSADSESEAREIVVPGFGAMVAVMGLLAVYLWRKRR